jgi:hypothetical protein
VLQGQRWVGAGSAHGDLGSNDRFVLGLSSIFHRREISLDIRAA